MLVGASIGYYYFLRPTAQEAYTGHIVIGNAIFPGYFPLYIADAKGYFKDEGIDVEIRDYTGLTDLAEDYESGKIQGRANLNFEVVHESLHGLDQKVVLAIAAQTPSS
jgi:NitT/TauT family transport system substrate-binding protein